MIRMSSSFWPTFGVILHFDELWKTCNTCDICNACNACNVALFKESTMKATLIVSCFMGSHHIGMAFGIGQQPTL
jgi:hypothetical protein